LHSGDAARRSINAHHNYIFAPSGPVRKHRRRIERRGPRLPGPLRGSARAHRADQLPPRGWSRQLLQHQSHL